ncbi:hypothetical protein JCM1841_005597 [Sporobolomyces salmonicolor]
MGAEHRFGRPARRLTMTFTFNDFLRLAKKAFKFWKKYQKQQQQQEQQPHGGQGTYASHPGQGQYQQGASPYPPAHQQQQQQGGWNQQHAPVSPGGYGAHDGPPTLLTHRTLLHLDDDIMDHFDPQNQDMANAANASYVELRNKAILEGDLMAKAFSESKQAYASGHGGDAHDLSMAGKEHQRNKDRYNAEAAEWIFRENNKTQPPGSVDLHGLYVQESIEYTERAIANAKQQGLSELRVIVGKGNHSPSHLAKIKPAITSLMAREHLTAHLDPHNGGVLVVQLQGQGGGKRGDEMMREMEGSRENDCVVM